MKERVKRALVLFVNRNGLTDLEMNFWLQRAKVDGDRLGLGINMYAQLFKMDNHKHLLYSTGNSANVMGQPRWEWGLGKNGCVMRMYRQVPLLST